MIFLSVFFGVFFGILCIELTLYLLRRRFDNKVDDVIETTPAVATVNVNTDKKFAASVAFMKEATRPKGQSDAA